LDGCPALPKHIGGFCRSKPLAKEGGPPFLPRVFPQRRTNQSVASLLEQLKKASEPKDSVDSFFGKSVALDLTELLITVCRNLGESVCDTNVLATALSICFIHLSIRTAREGLPTGCGDTTVAWWELDSCDARALVAPNKKSPARPLFL